MAPLLADDQVQAFDIIAVQEPWRNPYQNQTYCLKASGFVPAYNDLPRRCCFLISRRLDTAFWDVEFPSADLAIMCLQVEGRTVWIYNIYSPPPGSYTMTEYSIPITSLAEYLVRPREHILLGDFNLHHPLWCGPRNPSTHAAADRLVSAMFEHNMALVSPKGVTTWEAHGHTSTIDLVFMSPFLQQQVVRCEVREDLDFGSDHYPIATRLLLNTICPDPVPRHRWKGMNIEAILAGAQHLATPEGLQTAGNVDGYTRYLIGFIQGLIEHTVPWAKPSPHGQPWWT